VCRRQGTRTGRRKRAMIPTIVRKTNGKTDKLIKRENKPFAMKRYKPRIDK
jgi:hypothetical protein